MNQLHFRRICHKRCLGRLTSPSFFPSLPNTPRADLSVNNDLHPQTFFSPHSFHQSKVFCLKMGHFSWKSGEMGKQCPCQQFSLPHARSQGSISPAGRAAKIELRLGSREWTHPMWNIITLEWCCGIITSRASAFNQTFSAMYFNGVWKAGMGWGGLFCFVLLRKCRWKTIYTQKKQHLTSTVAGQHPCFTLLTFPARWIRLFRVLQ